MSGWADSHNLGGIEAKIGAGQPLSTSEMFLLQGGGVPVGSSIAPSGFVADLAPGNQADIWNDFVARVQDRESGGNSIADAVKNFLVAPAAFFVGGVSGASAATGHGITTETVAADAAGLAAGAGIAASGVANTGVAIDSSFDAGMADFVGAGNAADAGAINESIVGIDSSFDVGMADYVGLGNAADSSAVAQSVGSTFTAPNWLTQSLSNIGIAAAQKWIGSHGNNAPTVGPNGERAVSPVTSEPWKHPGAQQGATESNSMLTPANILAAFVVFIVAILILKGK